MNTAGTLHELVVASFSCHQLYLFFLVGSRRMFADAFLSVFVFDTRASLLACLFLRLPVVSFIRL